MQEFDAVTMNQLGNFTSNLHIKINKIKNLQNGTYNSDSVSIAKFNLSRYSLRRKIDACLLAIEKYKMGNNIKMLKLH